MAKISIIIPVYNTGKYLYKCLESVLSQTHSDLEVIMVDDGSDAETACICDEIASMDSRVRLVHKQNEGVSIARNIGIDMGYLPALPKSKDMTVKDYFEQALSFLGWNSAREALNITECWDRMLLFIRIWIWFLSQMLEIKKCFRTVSC